MQSFLTLDAVFLNAPDYIAQADGQQQTAARNR
jgi:hypothetical protein